MTDGLSRAYDDDEDAIYWAKKLGIPLEKVPIHGRWRSPDDVFKLYAKKMKVTLPNDGRGYNAKDIDEMVKKKKKD